MLAAVSAPLLQPLLNTDPAQPVGRFTGLADVGVERPEVLREHPGLREEAVVLGELLGHPGEVPRQQVLPADLVHPREVVDPLVPLERDL